MFISKFLIVLGCYSVYGLESSGELESLLANRTTALYFKSIIGKVYNENKLQTISTFEEILQDIIDNVTLVGSQNIYGNNGEILEIRTVELHLSKIPAKGDVVKLSLFEDSEEEDDDITMSEVRPLFSQISAFGFELIAEVKEFNVKEEIITHTYMEEDLYYHYFDGQHIVNKTIEVESLDVVERAVTDLKKEHGRLSIHKFDDKRQFVAEGSVIVPEYVAMITADEGEVHQDLIDEILKGASSLFIESNEDFDDIVPSRLVKYLKSRFNGTDFYVVSGEPEAWYLRDDNFFRVAVEYDLHSWDSNEEIVFTVFGTKTNPN